MFMFKILVIKSNRCFKTIIKQLITPDYQERVSSKRVQRLIVFYYFNIIVYMSSISIETNDTVETRIIFAMLMC